MLILSLLFACNPSDAVGDLGSCAPEGHVVYDDTEDTCCSGLSYGYIAEPGEPQFDQSGYDLPEGCALDQAYVLGGALCLACGDGTCADHENRCNCPEDCEG